MIERATRALPGMIVMLLLNFPVFAAPSNELATQDASPIGKSSIDTKVATKITLLQARGIKGTLPQNDIHRIIRKIGTLNTPASTGDVRGALIDDGTMWRERGNTATWQQTGVASWYGGKRWQGRQTTSGVPYDENALTAAHATLPLGTKVRVTTHNGARSVIVTINDRPGTRTRIIDLSREAAKALGILDAGVAMVTLNPL